ncbi:unnamed protein product [Mucor hiemalis]
MLLLFKVTHSKKNKYAYLSLFYYFITFVENDVPKVCTKGAFDTFKKSIYSQVLWLYTFKNGKCNNMFNMGCKLSIYNCGDRIFDILPVSKGLSLYFAILSFQAKSPFYSYMESTALYIFGTINLILFGVSLGTLLPLFMKSMYGIRTSSAIINTVIFILLVDMIVNTIVFIVRRGDYVHWCINSTSANLDNSLDQRQIAQQQFNPTMADFYNCNRTWENEVKFSVLSTLVIIFTYVITFSVCLYS